MENRRLQWFLVAIGAGLVLGLILGWSVLPRKAADMSLQDLRADYKLDYVLMVATIYNQDNDLAAARTRLQLIDNSDDPAKMIQALMDDMTGWSDPDVQLISKLFAAFQVGSDIGSEGRAA